MEMYTEVAARGMKTSPEEAAREIFRGFIREGEVVDALFTDSSFKGVIGVANLPVKAPVTLYLFENSDCAQFLNGHLSAGHSVLITLDGDNCIFRFLIEDNGVVKAIVPPLPVADFIKQTISESSSWAGKLNENGEHVFDLRSPAPGPHFFINLLMGNRIGFAHALQTKPKSVVDKLGRGSFRSHAATQVLATRWDMRQEENGFPANRQFYIVENSKKIFYTADPNDSNIESAECIHSQNCTIISYRTKCGLEIKRTIFILPQMEGLPLAVETQVVEITNTGPGERHLRLVYTGMFGSAAPHALQEDVLYSNVIMQTKLLKNEDGSIAAIGPDYYPLNAQEDMRFHTMMMHQGNRVSFPGEFCSNINDFIGNGTLENPHGINNLGSRMYRKGPGFFALAGSVVLQPGEHCVIDNFTGAVSKKVNPHFSRDTFREEIGELIRRFSKPGESYKALEENRKFYDRYRNFIQVHTSDEMFDVYFNRNLPFQVLYQTFVSRSFCQTQKGYREIGFREIQDVYAAGYYFAGMGLGSFVKELLMEWCGKVFEFGYAYHNFFWQGKEPGKWSDDALWFVQAVYRYINLTGDKGFLEEECEIAGTLPVRKRSVYDTMKAIIRYSGEISVGKHGMPLMDSADWNDCLKLDKDFIDGITKEKVYREQINRGGVFGEPLESDYSESVMNAFLLKSAMDAMLSFARELGDDEYISRLSGLSQKLFDNIQKHAWKGDFFARALFNRYKEGEFSYLGAGGDNLSADPGIDGSYFLNSFSWAVLSDCASEEQIAAMLDTIEKFLKTPYGLKLMTPVDLGRISEDTAAGHYFPGDRENGAVFKHAAMMATAAMFKAAKKVESRELAARLSRLAYWMIEKVLPYRTMSDPYVVCGNPRFCTQYNNSETGENIGPMLSGTSTWLTLSLLSAIGIEYAHNGIIIDPILKDEDEHVSFIVNTEGTVYKVNIHKQKGFCRVCDGSVVVRLDGSLIESNVIPLFKDKKEHSVEIIMS